MEMQGLALRGAFEHPHRRSKDTTTKSSGASAASCSASIASPSAHCANRFEPVPPAVYMRWLLGWQHLAPQTQLAGEEGVLEALSQTRRL